MVFPLLKRRARDNRRFRRRKGEHQLTLEVPLSKKEVVMRRRRMALRVLRWAVLGGAVVWTVVFACGLWRRAFTASGDFAVGQFELVTNGVCGRAVGQCAEHLVFTLGQRSIGRRESAHDDSIRAAGDGHPQRSAGCQPCRQR